jgi:hypothetical protein
MNKLTALFLSIALALTAAPSHAMTVDEIVAKYVEALGGMAHLKAIQSIRTFGEAKLGGGDWSIEASFASVTKRPGKSRFEFSIQGMTGVDGYDGAEGWSTEPWEGRKDPFRKSQEETKSMAQNADIDGPLVDWRAKGHKVEYLGTEDIDGTPAHKLRTTLKDGDVEYDYLDPDTFLPIRQTKESHVRGAEHVQETDVGAYARVAGVWMPFESDSGGKGEPKTAHFHITRVEVNVDAPDSLFSFPPAGTRVTKAIVEGPPSAAASSATGAVPMPPPHTVLDSGALSGLGARNIGSAAMSGRVAAVAAYNEDGKTTIFVGAASGGVWKSIDGGTTFKPVFDRQRVQSIGAIAIDPSNTKNVWVGSGESWTRNSVSLGDGIYKSSDGGSTARVGAHRAGAGAPDQRRRRLRVRARKALQRQRGSWRLQDDRRRQALDAHSQRGKPLDGLLGARDGPEEPRRALRGHLGLPSQGVDVPLGRRGARRAERKWHVSDCGRRQDMDADDGDDEQRHPCGPLGPRRGRGRAERPEGRVCAHRVEGLRALPLGGRRGDVGAKGQQSERGLAAVLLRAPRDRPAECRPPLQA